MTDAGIAEIRDYAFKYQLSYWTLLNWRRKLQVVNHELLDETPLPLPPLAEGSDGIFQRSVPVQCETETAALSAVTVDGRRFLRYVLQRFPRYYIDMAGLDFDAYRSGFSGKTRSTLARKVRKFQEHCGGTLHWERFDGEDGLDRFWALAREVSEKTYQERWLDAGLPDDANYREQARQWARQDNLRAFLLFDGDKPVSYLFCPVRDDVIEYAYLGYDPSYQKLSVGTVLQWLALESLFAERRFRCFDFTEGEAEHKRLFGTGRRECANVVLLRPTLANFVLTRSHLGFRNSVEAIGGWLERHELKAHVRRWLRFGLRS
jgi:hypothetical protein